MYARIENGVVAELLQADSQEALAERYHPDLAVACVPVPAGVQPAEGWRFDGHAFSPPPPAALPDAADLRARRNALLAGCDWTQLPDAQLTEPQRLAWAYYRHELRALPEQPGFPNDVAWPEAPR